jgi:hypothetical protein
MTGPAPLAFAATDRAFSMASVSLHGCQIPIAVAANCFASEEEKRPRSAAPIPEPAVSPQLRASGAQTRRPPLSHVPLSAASFEQSTRKRLATAVDHHRRPASPWAVIGAAQPRKSYTLTEADRSANVTVAERILNAEGRALTSPAVPLKRSYAAFVARRMVVMLRS